MEAVTNTMGGSHTLEGVHYRTGRPIRMYMAGGTIERIEVIGPVGTGQETEETAHWQRLPRIGPGFVDLQINGCAGVDFHDPRVTTADVLAATKKLWTEGTTTYWPTVTTTADDAIETLVRTISLACRSDPHIGGSIAGIHLEGPFISPEDGPRGAHDRTYVKAPDWELFERWQRAADGLIHIVTLSPEWEEAPEFIAKCVSRGIVASIGHTAASAEQIRRAVQAGATMSTHLGNGAHLHLPRHPNYIWEQLAEDRLFAGVIADGFHLPASVLKVFCKAKAGRLLLVSDASYLSGLAPGVYDRPVGGSVVLTAEGRLHLADHPALLAGSAQRLASGVEHMARSGVCALAEAWDMASVRPAAFMNVPSGKGLAEGAPADVITFLWRAGRKLEIHDVYKNGCRVAGSGGNGEYSVRRYKQLFMGKGVRRVSDNGVMNNGVLRQSKRNPRYFEDGLGRLILLSGSHTWANMQDLGNEGDPPFDYEAYLDMLSRHNHNFIRLWQWGHFRMTPWTLDPIRIEPQPYERTGDGTANDGRPKFDLDRWNEAYFSRLRDRVVRAGERGMYVSIMFYDGWCLKHSRPECDSWFFHPFHPANNSNGVHGGNEDNSRAKVNTLDNPGVLERQKAFIRKVIDTVHDLDHVLYEIINETEESEKALQWQNHLVDYVRQYESVKGKRHPVGMTAADGRAFNSLLFESNADWISPSFGCRHEYEHNPPEADGRKVILADTDHIWGHGGHYIWVWKSFTRGIQPIFMDSWGPLPGTSNSWVGILDEKNSRDYPAWAPLRANMGHIRTFAGRIDLARMTPHKHLASSGFCLADPGNEYLVFVPPEERYVKVDLRASGQSFRCEWFDPLHAETVAGDAAPGGWIVRLNNPFPQAAVLHMTLHR